MAEGDKSVEVCRVKPVKLLVQETITLVSTHVILSRTGMVVRVRLHPPAMLPESDEVSSTTKSFHGPLGFAPWNTDRESTAFELPAGAGAGKSNMR